MKIGTSESYRAIFVECFRDNEIIPIVVSGISVGCNTENGIVPNGDAYKKHMLESISDKVSEEELKSIQNMDFSKVAEIYEDESITSSYEQKKYLKENFYKASYSEYDRRKSFFDIKWAYVYSLNIDDVIENSTKYKDVILPNRRLESETFADDYCLIKLHGDIGEIIKYRDSYKVFTSKEYAKSLNENRELLIRLKTDCDSSNILFIGCSLQDEVDILSLDIIPSDSAENTKHNFFFSTKKPSHVDQIRLKNYGVTDYVLFESNDDMYKFLLSTWDEAQKIAGDRLSDYRGLNKITLKASDAKNQNIFYNGMSLIDYKDDTITFPHYMIERDLVGQIRQYISKHKTIVIHGQRYCGKSYLLVYLYKLYSATTCYIFSNHVKLSDESVDLLVTYKNAVIFIDEGSLTSQQYLKIIDNSDSIQMNKSSVVIMIEENDTESYILAKRKMELNGTVELLKRPLRNRFSNTESAVFNNRLPESNMMPYDTNEKNNRNETLLDHLTRSAALFSKQNLYSDKVINADSAPQLAYFIALASKETLYYTELVRLELTEINSDMLKLYSPFVEMIKTKRFERSNKNMSNLRVALNSKFWLNQQLSGMAEHKNNYDIIVDAYRYIIEREIDFSSVDLRHKRKMYKDYTFFDTINAIFGGANGGKMSLIVAIYNKLTDILADDFQFNHQRANCLLYYAGYLKKDYEKVYEEARNAAIIARQQVENEMRTSSNSKMEISLAHINYTIATIDATLCEIDNFDDDNMVTRAIKQCWLAVINPYNEMDFERDLKHTRKYGIVNFIKGLTLNSVVTRDKDIADKYSELLGKVIHIGN